MILVSIYKGLNEILYSSHPGRGGGYFPTHFLYAWLAKNFDVYELVGEASSSPGMVKFSGIGHAKSFQLEEARELIGDAIYSREILLVHFVNGGPRCSVPRLAVHMPVIPRENEVIYLTRILQRMKANLVLNPNCSFWKPLRAFCSADRGSFFLCQDSRNRCCHPSNAHPYNPYSKHCATTIDGQDEIPIGVCEPTTEKVTELPPEGVENIMDIFNSEPNPTECMGESDDVNFKKELAHIPLPLGSQCFPRSRLVDPRGVCPLYDDEVESIRRVNAPSLAPRRQRPLGAPHGGISIFNAEVIINEVDKNAARDLIKPYSTRCVAPLLISFLLLKAILIAFMPLSFKEDLQQSYSGQTSAEEHDTYRMEVQGKLDEASRQLNTEDTHYKAKTAELKHKYPSSQEAASEHWVQEAEWEVIDLQATKASLEKDEAYIKESFEDLKNFQWDP
ncbi:LOW QUALITY PROTEIN: hypothetical protein Cgig2_033235 [Carnegiea gigantea]|uniref:Uncharacterized protein n=1 Tax=Carnegiea gigantea TaxID=171969 RepID=A0A9Q1GXF5_9CARY|nr:LOW QUALITY PROTEIN: hypothetical protein Cgig2_033235 [Carnegiea gigantea]